MDDEDFALRDHDERDEAERLAEPAPAEWEPLFEAMTLDPLTAPPAGRLALLVVNRPLPKEAVPRCRISLDSATGTTDDQGRARLDISELSDGEYVLTAIAPDIFEGPIGPGFPDDTSKPRIWRPFRGEIRLEAGKAVAAEPKEWVKIDAGTNITVRLQPAWIKARRLGDPNTPDMIVIHHTHGTLPRDLETLISGKSVHYFVAPYGEVYKLVDESRTAAHAGDSHWQGQERLNSRSIGIEISRLHNTEYPTLQIDAVIELLRRLGAQFPDIPPGRVVAHSDIGLCYPNSTDCRQGGPKRLGRKEYDPGSAFPWELVEALGLSLRIKEGTVVPDIYGGYYKLVPDGQLIPGDNDTSHRYGGKTLSDVKGAIRELQKDLSEVGYFCPVDGAYGEQTQMAVMIFQRHIFSGSRRTGHPDNFTSGDGRCDLATAEHIKKVLGQVEATGLAYLLSWVSRQISAVRRRMA